jgi:hypothetical protein
MRSGRSRRRSQCLQGSARGHRYLRFLEGLYDEESASGIAIARPRAEHHIVRVTLASDPYRARSAAEL